MSHRGEPPLEKQGSCSCPERMALAVPYIQACVCYALLAWELWSVAWSKWERCGAYNLMRVLHSLPELASLRTLRCRNRHAAHGLDRGCS